MSKSDGEHKSLLGTSPKEPERKRDQMMSTLQYSSTNGNVTVQHEHGGEGAGDVPHPLDIVPDRASNSRHDSTLSRDGLENTSLMGSVVQPQDLQELMANLEKATKLVKRYLQDNQGVNFGARKPTKRPLIPHLITNYLLVITFLWQAVTIGVIEGIDRIQKTHNSTDAHEVSIASNIVMTIFQLVHIVIVFFVSFKLVKQVMHGTASASLLAQSYLSTVLLFAGLYTLEYRFDRKGWSHVVDSAIRTDIRSDSNIIATLLFLRMLYFSISTGSLCGTSAIEPIAWYGGLTVSLQMLMSFVYFASILSLGLRVFTQGGPKHHVRSLTKKIRECVFRERSRSNSPNAVA